jgi:hypothetical protein
MKTFRKFRTDCSDIAEELEATHDLSVLEFAMSDNLDEDEIEEDEGGAPTNNIGGGNIAGRDIPLGVPLVGPRPYDNKAATSKIYRRSKPKLQ